MILKKRIFDVTCSVVLLISLMIIAAGVTSYADMIKKEDITNLEQELESIKKRQEATEKELAEIEKDENYVESSIAYSVSLLPVPAITGTRPAVFSTANLIHSRCSSSVRVDASPVVPQITIASVLLFI